MTYIPVSSGARISLGNAPYVYNYRSQFNTTKLSQGLPIPTAQDPKILSTNPVPFTLAGSILTIVRLISSNST